MCRPNSYPGIRRNYLLVDKLAGINANKFAIRNFFLVHCVYDFPPLPDSDMVIYLIDITRG